MPIKLPKNTANKLSRRSLLKKGALLSPLLFGIGACGGKTKKGFDVDVIIVGAGLSGLNAALLLEKAGFNLMIVEATDRIGGRLHTAKENDVPGHPELGGNGIGGGYARILDAAKKYGVKIGPMRPRTEPRKGEILYAIKNELILPEQWTNHPMNPYHDKHRKGSPTSPPWSIYGEKNPLPKGDLAAWKSGNFKKWDLSVYDLLKGEGFSEASINLGVNTNSSYGVDAKTISALMYFQIMNFIMHQADAPKGGGAAIGGNQRIPEAMAANVAGDILLESPVKAVVSDKNGVTVTLENDKKLTAPYALVTLPTAALRRIHISPKPPTKQQKAISQLDYTPSAQLHFVPIRKYWEDDGLPPSMWTDQLGGRFMALKNNINNPDEVTSCVAYTNSKVALKLDKMEEKDRVAAVLQSLEQIRPSLKSALQPVYNWNWSNNRFAGGAYAYWKPGQITDFANDVALPLDRIHFAGEHTAVLQRGMEGAMESGERAAFELMNLLT